MTTNSLDTGAGYDSLRERYSFLADSYWGGARYRSPSRTTLSAATAYAISTSGGSVSQAPVAFTTYLVPHAAEASDKFSRRLALAVYINIVAPVVDAYAESVTANVVRAVPDSLMLTVADCDGRGSSWGEHVEEVARWTCVYGMIASVVDAPNVVAQNKAEEAALGIKPRVLLVQPTAWAWLDVDDDGQLTEFAYVEQSIAADQTQGAAQQFRKVRVRLWTTLPQLDVTNPKAIDGPRWEIREGSVDMNAGSLRTQRGSFGAIVETGPMAKALGGKPPVVFNFYKRVSASRFPLGQSLVDDVADIGRSIYNKLSWEDEIHAKAGFPFLAIPMASSGGQMDPGTRKAIGPDKAMPYDSATGRPEWIQPSAESSKELRESCVFRFQLALRTAGLELVADASAQVQSGEALRIRSRDFESRAKRFANNMTRYENATLALVALLSGEATKPTATYPKRFTLPDSVEDLANALTLLDPAKMPLEIGPDGKIAAAKQALAAALSLSDEDTATIIEWIRNHLGDEVADMGQARAIDVALRGAKLAELTPVESEVQPGIDGAAMPVESAAAKVEVFSYDYDADILTLNEARRNKGLPEIPEAGSDTITVWKARQAAAASIIMRDAGMTGTVATPSMGAEPNATNAGTLDDRSAA